MVCGASGNEATNWCKMYQASDFNSFGRRKHSSTTCEFPFPFGWPISEIAAYNLLGSTWLITDLGYRAALVAAFLLAIGLSASSQRRMLWSLAICSIFLTGIMLINPGSRCTMIYDAYLPLFGLSYIALLKLCVWPRLSRSPKLLAVVLFGCGLLPVVDGTDSSFRALCAALAAGRRISIVSRTFAQVLLLFSGSRCLAFGRMASPSCRQGRPDCLEQSQRIQSPTSVARGENAAADPREPQPAGGAGPLREPQHRGTFRKTTPESRKRYSNTSPPILGRAPNELWHCWASSSAPSRSSMDIAPRTGCFGCTGRWCGSRSARSSGTRCCWPLVSSAIALPCWACLRTC